MARGFLEVRGGKRDMGWWDLYRASGDIEEKTIDCSDFSNRKTVPLGSEIWTRPFRYYDLYRGRGTHKLPKVETVTPIFR